MLYLPYASNFEAKHGEGRSKCWILQSLGTSKFVAANVQVPFGRFELPDTATGEINNFA